MTSNGTNIRHLTLHIIIFTYLDDIDLAVFNGIPNSVQTTDSGVLL